VARRTGDDLAVEVTALARTVGERLRARRRELARTLSEVAGEAGVSVSYLSAVETGRSLPSLPTLVRVASALGISLNELLRETGGGQAVARSRLRLDRAGHARLSSGRHHLEVVSLVAAPGRRDRCPLPTGKRDVFVYLLSGSVTLTIDGARCTLHAGDSLDAETPQSVSYEVEGEEQAAMIWATADAPGAR
jgi:transcriptional regulator with XRE-family HTH domain